jgi:hypothetical protein
MLEKLDYTALMGPDVVDSEKALVGTTTEEKGGKGTDSDDSDDEDEDENSHIFAVPCDRMGSSPRHNLLRLL